MTYSEIVKKENRDGFRFVLIPMIVLGILAIYTDFWLFGLLAVIVFIIGIFAIHVPAETRLRVHYIKTIYVQPKSAITYIDPVAIRWAEGKHPTKVQKILPERDIEKEYKSLDMGYKRWLACQKI